MLELTEKRLVALLWVLKHKGKTWSVNELRHGIEKMLGKREVAFKPNNKVPIVDIDKTLDLTYRPTLTFVKELEKNGFVAKEEKTGEFRVAKAIDLVKFISLARPFASMKTINYHSPINFFETMKIINESKPPYAFTIFAGSELYRPYVKTSQIHVYIKEGEEKDWQKYLLSKNFLKSDKSNANLFLVPTKNTVLFQETQKIKGLKIVPLPILISDLISFGGLAQEQGEFLLEEWLNERI